MLLDLVPSFDDDDDGVPWLSLSQAGAEVVAFAMVVWLYVCSKSRRVVDHS